MPDYAILDPVLTASLPPSITAITGMDALSHAVEAYTNHTYNTKYENELCKKAVKLIAENLYNAYLDGQNLDYRQNMQKAAFYAGRAFTRGSVGYVHALGHTLGGLYNVPHGLAMAILLPKVLREYKDAVYLRLSELADVLGIQGNSPKEKALQFIEWIEDLNKKMNIPNNLDIKEEDIPQIVNWAHSEGNPLYPTPVTWTKEDFTHFVLKLKEEANEKM